MPHTLHIRHLHKTASFSQGRLDRYKHSPEARHPFIRMVADGEILYLCFAHVRALNCAEDGYMGVQCGGGDCACGVTITGGCTLFIHMQ